MLHYSYKEDRLVSEEELRQEYDSMDATSKASIFGQYIQNRLSGLEEADYWEEQILARQDAMRDD